MRVCVCADNPVMKFRSNHDEELDNVATPLSFLSSHTYTATSDSMATKITQRETANNFHCASSAPLSVTAKFAKPHTTMTIEIDTE